MMRKSIFKNKRGDFVGIIGFAAVVLIMILMAPMLVKVVVTPLDKFSTALSTVDTTNRSSDAVDYVQNKFTGMFDWIILLLFIFNIVLLLVTSFLVDVHPAFLIVYILALIFLVIFAPNILDAVNNVWNMSQFSTEVSYLPMLGFLKDNFMFILLGIAILTGLIMYGKYSIMGGGAQSSGGNYY